jgi:hypothetical protein
MKTLTLSVPDRTRLESELGITTPFWRWTVVDQPLIDHWIDHARDQGYRRIEFSAENNTESLAQYLAAVPMFDCEWEVLTDSAARSEGKDAARLSDLPGIAPLHSGTITAWDLVDHHHRLERWRLTQLWDPASPDPPSVCLGRFARVHPSARIMGPVWIGDNSRIGPDTQLGPFTVIGANCVISQGVSIRSTSVAEETVLGAFTEFDGHLGSGSDALNRSEHLRLDSLDPAIARSAKSLGLARRLLSLGR